MFLQTRHQNFSCRTWKSKVYLCHRTVRRPFPKFELKKCFVQQVTRDQKISRFFATGSRPSQSWTCSERAASSPSNTSPLSSKFLQKIYFCDHFVSNSSLSTENFGPVEVIGATGARVVSTALATITTVFFLPSHSPCRFADCPSLHHV